MEMPEIHPSAIVSPESKLGQRVKIGPYSIIGPDVSIGDDTIIHSHVVLDGKVTMGKENQIYPFCSIGAPPQDQTYKDEPTEVIIGDGNILREYVSVHRGTIKEEGITEIGSHCMLMAHVHVGHDARVGNKCVIANTTNLAGHVKIGAGCIIGGGTNISQFVSLGRGCYIGGGSVVVRDIPSFCTGLGNRCRLKGINIIGLKRNGFDKKIVTEVVDFFRGMEASALSPRSYVGHEENLNEHQSNEVIQEMISMINGSQVGMAPFVNS
jgi:UDP-N-acetylglucosamine acyltransferase